MPWLPSTSPTNSQLMSKNDPNWEENFLAQRVRGFREVLAFEGSTPQLMEYTTADGVPYWAIIRHYLCEAINNHLNRARPVDGVAQPRPKIGRIARFCWESLCYNPFLAPRNSGGIVFINSGEGNFLKEGVYFNRLADYFAECYPDCTLLIERADQFKYYLPRAFNRVALFGGVHLPKMLWSHFAPLNRLETLQTDAFIRLLYNGLGDVVPAEIWPRIKDICKRRVAGARLSSVIDRCLLDRIQPKLLMVEEAHYGGHAHLIMAARAKQIPLAEYQHGLVSCNHPAYNYHPKLLEAGYCKVLPDYFLTYGQFWADQVSTSARMRIVGNPHLNIQAAKGNGTSVDSTSVLFVSGNLNPDVYREFLTSLSVEGFRITFRPHPLELNNFERTYGDFFKKYSIAIDTISSAYDSIQRYGVIVGDCSTLMLEAKAFDKPVFGMDYSETHKNYNSVFPLFRTGRDLRRLMNVKKTSTIDMNSVWADDWEKKYRSFVEEILGH